MKAQITRFDEELVTHVNTFLSGLRDHTEGAALLAQHGLDPIARAKGEWLVQETERAFEWERQGKAWNYLSPTPERRAVEARYWYKDGLCRHRQSCFRAVEKELRDRRPGSLLRAVRCALRAFSPSIYIGKHREFRRELVRAKGERPADAPLPKDTALVELAGWYERWSLMAIQIFRERPDLAAPLGLKPGRAAQRLRTKAVRNAAA